MAVEPDVDHRAHDLRHVARLDVLASGRHVCPLGLSPGRSAAPA
jgi:hypothetical protein